MKILLQIYCWICWWKNFENSQHLAKLWARLWWLVLYWLTVYAYKNICSCEISCI